ncbi:MULTISPECIES: MFS transporter [Tatumella]|uniref:MFS transporter n=1 Tax=Tatumella punctata TaxID=399969 RepID=A0ABW1VJ35_9GAMM|nr:MULTISPECIES: MFS transporter [unclassified Tatumella]MBS0855456.1 MFS transporter [Tatumella sp. JGM16]MBS0877172.1 MFS transporter [Tatumella sp. JGM82]MBS0889459.1 MFS transporter [Tatumella sp. JGM94]MBS0895021.1 MFS transporter [Tatumella sp. JGM130]MBS0901569.1 MFS transporter [Tatumella sp. JGM100]
MNSVAVSPASGGLEGKNAALLVSALMLAILAFQLNCSMLSPALPEMAKQLNVSMTDISAVSSLFFLSGSICGVVLSRFSDFIGRRRMLIAVMVICSVGTLISAFTHDYYTMLAGRVLQGASSATFQLSYLLLHQRISRRLFGTAIGVITAVNGGVGGIDGYIGGLLSDAYGYQSIFLITLAVCVVALVAISLLIPRDEPGVAEGKMDWPGAVILSFSIIFINICLDKGSSAGWLSQQTLLYLLLFVAAIVLFWFIEKRRAIPLVPVEHFFTRQFWPVIATTILILAGVFSVLGFAVIIISQDTHAGLGMSAARSSLLFLTPPALMGFLSAPPSGWLAGKAGWIKTFRTGLVLCLVLMVVITLNPVNKPVLIVSLLLLGITYYGVVLSCISGLSVLLSPKEAPSSLTAVNGASFGLGAGLGIGLIAASVGSGTLEGFRHGLMISTGLTALAVISGFMVKMRKT